MDVRDTDATLVALRELVASSGWQLLCAHAHRTWGRQALFDRLAARVRELPVASSGGAEQITLMVVAQYDAIAALLAYPDDTIKALERALAPVERPPVPRRGGDQ